EQDLAGGRQARQAKPAGSLERDERDVVLLVPALADEPVELVEEVVEELAARAFRVHQVAQLWKAEHVAGRPGGLDEAVPVQQDALARMEDRRCAAGGARPVRGPPRARGSPSRRGGPGASRSPGARSPRRPSARRAGCGPRWRTRPGRSTVRAPCTGRVRTCAPASRAAGSRSPARAPSPVTGAGVPRRGGRTGSGP